MPSQTQRYTIEATSSNAEAANARVNAGISQLGTTAKSATDQAGSSYEQFARRVSASARSTDDALKSVNGTLGTFARTLEHIGEAGLVAIGTFKAIAGAVGLYASQAGTAALVTDKLVESYRVARLILSPTLGTVAGLAAGYGVEKLLQNTYERGGTINQQAFTAAKTDNSLGGVEQLQNLARLRGAQQDAFISASQDLKKQLGTDTGQTALAGLGLEDSKDSVENLKNIGAAFAGISDPVEKARLAIELFGPSAQKILPQLSQSLADSASEVQKWGLEIGDDRAREITQFRENVSELKRYLVSFGDEATAAQIKASNFFAGVGARVGNTLLAGGNIAANAASNDYHAKFTDAENQDAFRLGVDPAVIRELRKPLSSVSTATPGFAIPDSDVQKALDSNVDGRLSTAQRDLNVAAAKLAGGGLSPADANTYNAQFATAQRQIGDLSARKAAIDKAAQDKTDAEANALDEKRRGSELSRTLAQLAAKTGEGGPYGALTSEIQKARTSVDKSGDIVTRDLTPDEQINAATAYHNVISELQKKDSTEALKQIDEQQQTRLRYDDELYQKRYAQENEISTITRDTLAKQFDSQRTDLDSAKESALNALKLADPNQTQAIAANLNIQSQYANQSAALDIEKIQRKQLSDLADKGLLTPEQLAEQGLADYAPDSTQARLRSGIIANSGADAAAVAQKNTQDLLHAQEQASLDSANLIKDANLKSFNGLKDQVTGILDSIESHGRNVFQALGDALKKSLLGAINDVISSQITAGLFGVFNPGQQVTGFAPQNGIRRQGLGGAFQSLGMGSEPSFSGGALVPAFAGGAPSGNVGFSYGTQDVVPNAGFIGASDSAQSGIESIDSSGGPQASLDSGGYGGGFASRFGLSGSMLAQLVGASPAVAGTGVETGYGSDSFKSSPDLSTAPPGSASYGASALTAGTIAVAAGVSSIPGYGGGPAHPSALAGSSGGLKGAFGKLTGKGGIGSLKDAVYNSGSIDLGPGVSTTAAGISSSVSQSLGGGIIGKVGGSIVGGAAGFAASDAGAAVGSSLLLGGLSAKHSTVLTDASDTAGGALLGANIGSKIPEVGEGPGAVIGAGGGLVAAGLKRGGFGGLGEDAVGGAISGAGIGFVVGGPIGAAIGAGVGAVAGAIAGVVRLFVKGDRQQIKDDVKNAYHLTISDSVADQIQSIAKQNFGGSYSIAIRSPQVLDLLNLYAQVTGQPFLIKNKPYSAYLTETTGGLKQVAQYVNGAPVSYASQAGIGVLNNQATTQLSNFSITQDTQRNHSNATDYNYTTPPTQAITLQLDGNATNSLLIGQTVAAIQGNPTIVAQANSDAYNQSSGRTNTAAQLLSPNLLYS